MKISPDLLPQATWFDRQVLITQYSLARNKFNERHLMAENPGLQRPRDKIEDSKAIKGSQHGRRLITG